MKKIKITYWIFTGLLSALMLFSGIVNIMVTPESVTLVSTHLGFPVYLIPFLGVAKTLAAIAILIPGFPRVKEWAYAGLAYDLLGALYSSISVGDPAKLWIGIFLPLGLLICSYIFYHKKIKASALVS